jgi:hypothetical protein
MGIGAFAYYRRVLDNQRVKLFDAVIEVCATLKAPEDIIAQLKAAKSESQFTSAVKSVKAALPDSLSIEGHSPLTVLYTALSEGVHELTDAQCLDRAHTVRLVLAELLDRVGRLMTDDRELKSAVNSLIPNPVNASDLKPHTV